MIAKELTFFGAPESPQEYVNKGVGRFEVLPIAGWDSRLEFRNRNRIASGSELRGRRLLCGAMFTAEHSRRGTPGQLVGGTVEVQVAPDFQRLRLMISVRRNGAAHSVQKRKPKTHPHKPRAGHPPCGRDGALAKQFMLADRLSEKKNPKSSGPPVLP